MCHIPYPCNLKPASLPRSSGNGGIKSLLKLNRIFGADPIVLFLSSYFFFKKKIFRLMPRSMYIELAAARA